MSLDAFGLYHPDLGHPAAPISAANYTSGDPNGVVIGNPGDEIFDTIGGTFWWKESGNGTATGWIEKLTLP